MKFERIVPCVCSPNWEENHITDSYYGMPELKVCGSVFGQQFYEAYCPKCRRGGFFQYKSAYLALKHWNEMQEHLRKFEDLWVEPNEK